VLLPQTDVDQAQVAADGIVKAMGRHVAVLGDRSIRVTASVGLAMFDGLSAAEVLACADLAMYEAKLAGRNRFALYDPSRGRRERVSARLAEVENLRTALEEDRFLLYGQPILDLRENAVRQYEVLLRLRDEEGGEPLAPSTFLYVAERFELIQAIDAWVARRAIELIAENERAGRRLVLHVNLSGKSIGDPKVAALTESALTEAAIDPSRLVFELTETAAIANIEEAKAFARRLRARGCRLALDDFGAGFGSFYYLKNLPFDYFKIDGDFIRGVAASPMDQLVVGAIVGIARGMGKETIAEFVTDGETVLLLARAGVDYAQGYHVGRPRPLRDLRCLPRAVAGSRDPAPSRGSSQYRLCPAGESRMPEGAPACRGRSTRTGEPGRPRDDGPIAPERRARSPTSGSTRRSRRGARDQPRPSANRGTRRGSRGGSPHRAAESTRPARRASGC
jgi:EAL domain-containing protein (putative c-di-GMP-specific phosphodiesterase class I)